MGFHFFVVDDEETICLFIGELSERTLSWRRARRKAYVSEENSVEDFMTECLH
jgi:hypothetical protein